MSTAKERAAAREQQLLAAASGQRRLARPEDYVYDKGQDAFWDMEDGTLHQDKAMDSSIPLELWRVEVEEGSEPGEGGRGRPRKRKERLIPPSRDIRRVENDTFVEGSTWWPGKPQIVHDYFINSEGFYPAPGRRSFNQYKPPPMVAGNAENAQVWVDHVKKLWPDKLEHEYFFDYCAHMIQRPDQKCNAAIVLSGKQGIGKDAALWPVRAAAGAWNCRGIDPDHLFSDYKPWVQTLMLVVDEVRPSKDEFHASSMYNILKPLIVTPPDTLPLNDKFQKMRYVINVMRVFITTNDWMAMYIPPEDRRMFIMHSTLPQKWHEAAGDPNYFVRLFEWMEAHLHDVAAWLRERDLSAFAPKAQVAKTAGWQQVAGSWSTPDDGVTAALEALGRPDAFFATELLHNAFDAHEEIAGMIKSPRKLSHRMQQEGYLARNAPTGDRWVFSAKGHTFRSRLAFVKQDVLSDSERVLECLKERGAALAEKSAVVQEKHLKVVR